MPKVIYVNLLFVAFVVYLVFLFASPPRQTMTEEGEEDEKEIPLQLLSA